MMLRYPEVHLSDFTRFIRARSNSVVLLVILLPLFYFSSLAYAADSDYFVTTWNTENVGRGSLSNSTSITIPTTGSGYSYQVDWNNDGDFLDSGEDIVHTGFARHDYGAGNGGEKTIRIKGTFPRIFFSFTGDREKILSVDLSLIHI